jgi:hypothetical protein
MPKIKTIEIWMGNLRLVEENYHREYARPDLGAFPKWCDAQAHALSSHPCRTAYFTMSMRPFRSSLRMAFAL